MRLLHVTFAVGSKLQSIGRGAFSDSHLHTLVLPATVIEIDPYAFSDGVCGMVTFDGPPPLMNSGDFVCSADSKMIFRWYDGFHDIVISAQIEVIGHHS
jgi:hypothetical protein